MAHPTINTLPNNYSLQFYLIYKKHSIFDTHKVQEYRVIFVYVPFRLFCISFLGIICSD